MSFDTFVTQDVVAGLGLTRAVADRTQKFLRWLVSRKADYCFSIGKREFKVAANGGSRIKERDDGGCVGHIVTEAAGGPLQLKFKLARNADWSGRLTLTFNPSRMLAAVDVAPTPSRAGKWESSGFIEFGQLGPARSWFPRSRWPLRGGAPRRFAFGYGGEDLIESDIRLERVRWDLMLPTRDPQRFLDLLPLIFEPVFKGDDGKVVKLSKLLRLKPTHDPDPHTGDIRSVILTRIQGERRKLFSIVFSQVNSAGFAALGEEGTVHAGNVTGLHGYVRMSVTAHPEGIARIIRAGERRV